MNQAYSQFAALWLLIFLLLPSVGCVGGGAVEKPAQQKDTVFFPPAPEKPRLQFLRSFAGSLDVEEGPSRFDSFVTGQKTQGERLDKPYGVAMRNGIIYVADTNFSVMGFDLKKRQYKRLEGAKGMGQLVQPINIHIDKAGNKYVTDSARSLVLVYDNNDFYVRSLTEKNWKPVDVTTVEDRIYVADRKNGDIKIFNKSSGSLVGTLGRKGNDPTKHLSIPIGITADKNGTLYISDLGRFQVVSYDRDGNFISSFGEPCRRPGCFARPRGVAIDRQGLLYVVDAAFENVQIFLAEEGQILTYFGGSGSNPGSLYLPAAVTIDYDNVEVFRKDIDPSFEAEYLVIVTSQFGDRAVNVYAFGKQKGVQYDDYRNLKKRAQERLEEFKVKNAE